MDYKLAKELMDYKLAKELEDKGFPEGLLGRHICPHEPIESNVFTSHIKECVKELVYVPTLSELIDACGDEFKGLYLGTGRMWFAEGGRKEDNTFPKEHSCFGKTPIEAVARLYLALKNE